MIEPVSFKTNIISNSLKAEKVIHDYDAYRNTIEAFSKDLFDNAPEPTPIVETLVKLVNDKNPTFNHPRGKAASLLLFIQFFAYKTYEKLVIKDLNKFKLKN